VTENTLDTAWARLCRLGHAPTLSFHEGFGHEAVVCVGGQNHVGHHPSDPAQAVFNAAKSALKKLEVPA
jgi:hypothetical protein